MMSGSSSSSSRAAALPSFYGPRSFVVPRDGEVTPALLHEQSAARAATSALAAARESAASAGAPGAAHKGAKVRARRQQRAAAFSTSASAAASTRLEEAAATRYATLVAQAAAAQQPLSPAAATFFTGSHLVPDDVAPQPPQQPHTARVQQQTQQQPQSQRYSLGSQTARSHSVASPTSGGRSSAGGGGGGGWSSSQGLKSRSSLEMHSPTSGPPSRPGETSTRRYWSRRVEQRRLAADGGGGGVAMLHAITNAHQLGSLPQPAPAPPATEPSPYPSPAHADAEMARHMHQQQLFPHSSDGSEDAESHTYTHAHKSLFTTPLPPHPPSHRHSHPPLGQSGLDHGAYSAAAAGAGVGGVDPAPAGSLLDPRFHRSLRSYTQQWWVRLHNSENKVNTSPYFIGNKSVYYHDNSDAPPPNAAAPQPAAGPSDSINGSGGSGGSSVVEESKEATGQARLPPIAPQAETASTLRALLQSAPAGSSSLHAPSRASGGGTARPAPVHGGTAAQRLAMLARHTRVQNLGPEAAGNLNPTWAAQPQLLTWKRHADTMTLSDPPPPPLPPPPVASPRAASAAAASSTPDDEYNRGLAEVRAIRAANARRGTQFEYDRVSELHGFLSQKNIRQLLRQSNYNRRELIALFVRFKALCALSRTPHGIDKGTFKRGVARLAVEDDRFVSRVFSLVDDDGSGQIEWEEFLMAMSALEKGELEAKVRFFFQTYDLDADGYINRHDLGTMFHSSSMLDDDETTVEVVNTFVNKVFATFNASASGRISFDDVLRYMQKHGDKEDVWDVFGRSMLQDFTARPNR